MEAGKTSKYFKYAIGEIILVVIGILIALQINNWNEAKKQKQKERFYLTELKKSLQGDLEKEFVLGIAYLNEIEEACAKLNDYYKNKTFSNDSLAKYFNIYMRGSWNFVFNTSTFENLKSTGVDIISNDTLRSKISLVYGYEYYDLKERSNWTFDLSIDRMVPIRNDFDAFKLDINDLNKLYEDIKTFNNLGAYNRSRRALIERAKQTKIKVESLINDIKTELKL